MVNEKSYMGFCLTLCRYLKRTYWSIEKKYDALVIGIGNLWHCYVSILAATSTGILLLVWWHCGWLCYGCTVTVTYTEMLLLALLLGFWLSLLRRHCDSVLEELWPSLSYGHCDRHPYTHTMLVGSSLLLWLSIGLCVHAYTFYWP